MSINVLIYLIFILFYYDNKDFQYITIENVGFFFIFIDNDLLFYHKVKGIYLFGKFFTH